MKILSFIWDNILFFISLFLLAFIPLYPKLPILDVQHTWVYIRLEDFVVTFAFIVWIILLLKKKITLRTPLTLPIMLFWIVGGVATLHGVLLIFPDIYDSFSNVAFLSMLRRIEYLFLFFIGFAAMKHKKFLSYFVFELVIVLLLIVAYGMGQKFLHFPAFLTMNEEVAKGIPIQLSSLSRIPSTFAGHYDLAAYLVLIIPVIVSLIFGFKNWLTKIILLITASLGFGLLFMTVSRVSFFVLLISLVTLFLLQKKRWVILSFFALTFVFLVFSPSLLQRFGNTVTEVDVLVDAKTGTAIGQVKEVPNTYFEDKIVVLKLAQNEQNPQLATASGILPFSLIPLKSALVNEPNEPTGENLPQGTSYVNLPLSPVIKKVDRYFFQKTKDEGAKSPKIFAYYGEYLIKKAKAYDLSFTTRFQGEWPRTIDAFKRNIFLGSGYGSVSLAVDNNYLRILGESGLFGLISFISIFIISAICIKKILPSVDSSVARCFVLGFISGTFGLILNAILIDVFEASKIAFIYWLLTGITLGVLTLYKKGDVDLLKEFKKALTSNLAFVIYIFIITSVLFFSLYSNYFVGDDFTWFRWVSDCTNCFSPKTIVDYFINSNGFFYRPGTKLYFSFMYSQFWLNQTVYHFVSIFLHFAVAVLLFFISKRILKDYFLSIIAVIIFVALSGHHEAIFWISSTGFLFNALFALLSLLFYIYWKEKKRAIYFVFSLVSITLSLLFHELGVIVPLLIILYDAVFEENSIRNLSKKLYYLVILSPILPYLLLRLVARSHWFNGDYSYNLVKLPFNFVGNALGYLFLNLFGPTSLPIYEMIRNFSKGHAFFAVASSIVAVCIIGYLCKLIIKSADNNDRKIVIFGSMFFVIALLPFLGLGTITSRYSYLSSIGFAIIFTLFLKKIYGYLLNANGRNIAILGTALISIVFLSIQLFSCKKFTEIGVLLQKNPTRFWYRLKTYM